MLLGLFGLALLIRIVLVRSELLLEYLGHEGLRSPQTAFWLASKVAAAAVLGVLGLVMAGGLLIEVLQVGVRIEIGPLGVKMERLSPGEGLKRIGQGLKRSWLLVVKFLILGSSFAGFLYVVLLVVPQLLVVPWAQASWQLLDIAVNFAVLSAVLLGLLALADYLIERRRFMCELSMSHAELKREYKEEEGDPYVRAQRRALHLQLSMQELAKRVRQSRCVLVERQ
jgi:flagellar biosynthesis protein FlhB